MLLNLCPHSLQLKLFSRFPKGKNTSRAIKIRLNLLIEVLFTTLEDEQFGQIN